MIENAVELDDEGSIWRAAGNLRSDSDRILVARIVTRHHGEVCPSSGNRPHRRALERVPVAPTPEHKDRPTVLTAKALHSFERRRQRIRRVCIVHDHCREIVPAWDPLHPTRHASG